MASDIDAIVLVIARLNNAADLKIFVDIFKKGYCKEVRHLWCLETLKFDLLCSFYRVIHRSILGVAM
jgi:hypothetical protein